MSLFEVKGWEVPPMAVATASPSQSSRKRKRATKETGNIQFAQTQLETMIRKFGNSEATQGLKEKRKSKKGERRRGGKKANVHPPTDHGTTVSEKAHKRKEKEGDRSGKTLNAEVDTTADISICPSKSARRKRSGNFSADPSKQPPRPHILSGLTSEKQASNETTASNGLTPLQLHMKGTLDGARFRWVNEMLYTSSSKEGHNLMREDPKLYEEYHIGFRQQVRSWPSNPISHYIKELSSYPRGTVIADLGCGDAALARSLVQKGYCVLSFDLVSDGVFVIEANVCERIPLPGSEELQAGDSQGQIVDLCVCALSLMSLDWIQCIRETWRILRVGGRLKIAEVASRFTDVGQFEGIIKRVGFILKSKDEKNSHFILFDFEKVVREPMNEKDWEKLLSKGTILKPCEYKRR